jgi:hypothetical protein
LFNANSAILQPYQDENDLIFNDDVHIVHAELDLYSASSLKQQSANRHVTLFGHILLIPTRPVFARSFSLMLGTLQRSNKYQFSSLWFDPIGIQTHDLQALEESMLTITPQKQFLKTEVKPENT